MQFMQYIVPNRPARTNLCRVTNPTPAQNAGSRIKNARLTWGNAILGIIKGDGGRRVAAVVGRGRAGALGAGPAAVVAVVAALQTGYAAVQ